MKVSALFPILALALATPSLAAEYEIHMLDRGSDGREMVFEPAFLHIEPGDTVHFIATNQSHNAESLDGMIPEGAEPFRGELNQNISVTFTAEGAHGIACRPHLGMGMVALVMVGDDPHNLEEMQQVLLPRGARGAFEALYAQLEEALAE